MKTLLLQREDLKNRLEEQVEKGEKRAADQARIAKVPLSSLLSLLLFLSLFLLLYRPPNSDIINFTEIMESILKNFLKSGTHQSLILLILSNSTSVRSNFTHFRSNYTICLSYYILFRSNSTLFGLILHFSGNKFIMLLDMMCLVNNRPLSDFN